MSWIAIIASIIGAIAGIVGARAAFRLGEVAEGRRHELRAQQHPTVLLLHHVDVLLRAAFPSKGRANAWLKGRGISRNVATFEYIHAEDGSPLTEDEMRNLALDLQVLIERNR